MNFQPDFELERKRFNIEVQKDWRHWMEKIPYIQFPPEVSVQVIPPYGGAMVRFKLQKGDKCISVYLDCFNRLGAMDGPYWEAYPINGDTDRYTIEDVAGLMQAIRTEFEI